MKSNVSQQLSQRRNVYNSTVITKERYCILPPIVITRESFSSTVVIHNYYHIYVCWCFPGLPRALYALAMTVAIYVITRESFSSTVVIQNCCRIYIYWCFTRLSHKSRIYSQLQISRAGSPQTLLHPRNDYIVASNCSKHHCMIAF